MVNLELDRVYIGKISKRFVKFTGGAVDIETFKEPIFIYQFDYVIPDPKLVGYGQTEEQVILEEYKLAEVMDVLYGAR